MAYLIASVRNDLHRGAEIIPAAFLGDHFGINPAGGRIIRFRRVHAGEALVMAQIQIGFGAVIGDEHLAVLVRAHRARIHIEIGVELAQAHAIAARLQEGGECRRGNAFAERGDHAAGDEYEPRHGRP
jgi:hypothetical protein